MFLFVLSRNSLLYAYVRILLRNWFCTCKYVVTFLSFSRGPVSLCLLLLLPQGQTSTFSYPYWAPSEPPYRNVLIGACDLATSFYSSVIPTLWCTVSPLLNELTWNLLRWSYGHSTEDESWWCWWPCEFSFSTASRADFAAFLFVQ